jgi:hypothetical protein
MEHDGTQRAERSHKLPVEKPEGGIQSGRWPHEPPFTC